MDSKERDGDLNLRGNCLWNENSRVYTRRKSKKAPSFSNNGDPSNPATAVATAGATALSSKESLGQEQRPPCDFVEKNMDSLLRNCTATTNAESRRVQDSILRNDSEARGLEKSPPVRALNEAEDIRQSSPRVESELCHIGEPRMHKHDELSVSVEANGGALKPLVVSHSDDRVRFTLAKATPKDEIKDLAMKLQFELDEIRKLMKRLESPEIQENQPATCSHASYSNLSNGSNVNGGEGGNNDVRSPAQTECAATNLINTMPLSTVNTDGESKGNVETRPHERELTVSVTETNLGSNEYVEKEKRTPKANHYYKSSDFVLGKDKLPSEGAKRSKTSNGKKQNEHAAAGFGLGSEKQSNQLYKNCSSLLQRLMKHKHGWVFNEPVNVEALGCVDYHEVIKHPMDFGTIKARLSQRSYETPSKFAEDVRLVFQNAMTYNPKGHDVHAMAEQLSQIFEERWVVIESELNSQSKLQIQEDDHLPTPRSRNNQPRNLRSLDVPAKKSSSRGAEAKVQLMPVVRTPVGKKPKAKDPNKRNMTYEEKQKLSANLEKLPPEKLDAIIQIIKKRNTALSQNDDEIEVDIDSVDAETLWELDRFVTNYKKNMSKKRRRAEIAVRARSVANVAPMDAAKEAAASRNNNETAFDKGLGQGGNKSSSSGNSSSGDSGSSSSGK